MDQSDGCSICGEATLDENESAVLTIKGCVGINQASRIRNDLIIVSPGQRIHTECRRIYVNPCQIKKKLSESFNTIPISSPPPTLRSKEAFKFSEQCLFCVQPAKVSDKKRGCDVYPVRTNDFQSQILLACDEREDDWATQVRGRLESVNDLHAADAIYHQTCSVNFRTQKQIPKVFSLVNNKQMSKKGRPSSQNEHFLKVIEYIEEMEDQNVTLSELISKMTEMCGDNAFTARHLKRRLVEHYEDDIIFTQQPGKTDIITIREAVHPILQSFYQRPKHQDEESEKRSIIQTAAKLIRNDVLSMASKPNIYPSPTDISSEGSNLRYLPDSLLSLLKNITCSKDSELKVAAIGQSIVQATRPRLLLAPLQMGLGVQLHHQFGSKFLVDTLHALGFCVSYTEIQRFESSAAYQQGTDIAGFQRGNFVQYIADNVDHNSCTLDGKGTFHGMGIIASTTPGGSAHGALNRLDVHKDDIKASGGIDIKFYQSRLSKFTTLTYGDLKDLRAVDNICRLDMSSSLLWLLRHPMPGWSGIMQMCQKGSFPGKSSVTFLPMIDMSASDPSCIYTTMLFVCDHARRYEVSPVLTFDQPLFWKASTIIANEPAGSPLHAIVLRLGAFHTEMSFLGCIGHIMSGSGLRELIEIVYATNAVTHILSGKAVSRAVRAHFLVDTALHALLMSKCFRIPLPSADDEHGEHYAEPFPCNDVSAYINETMTGNADEITSNQERKSEESFLNTLRHLIGLLLSREVSVEAFCNHDAVRALEENIVKKKEALQYHRTAKLWLEYTKMVSILKVFIRAERTGNWKLHLQAANDMLPYFAAAGHNFYAKSAYIYLMNMQQLEDDHPDIHTLFLNGHHVLRRSDRYWAGLSSDLMIEQVLMRSLKTSGGLTRGRGMTEFQRAKWLQSMPACADVNQAVQDVTKVGFHTNDQHKESSVARQERDKNDIISILGFLRERDPFADDPSLRNIETGVVADKNVNSDAVESIGAAVIQSMAGKKIQEFTFKKSNRVVTMNKNIGIKVEDETVQVDPQLLFQRLIIAAKFHTDDVSNLFQYELCSVPSSLFDSAGLPREAVKPQIADAIWKMDGCGVPEIPESTCPKYVIDGGSLLQRIPWTRGDSFASICELYVKYVERRYREAVVVFDGYSNQPSTKDITHIRRSKGISSQRINFTEEMPCKAKKEQFLANAENKQQLINLLSQKLNEKEYETVHADGDADKLIVQTAVNLSSSRNVVLIGEDTDLLVLLCYYANTDGNKIYFKTDSSKGKTKAIWDIQNTKAVLGPEVCSLLPVFHALTGCDTTSRLYGIGKGVALKKLSSNQQYLDIAKIFLKASSKRDEIMKAGEDLMVFLYGGVCHERLDLLRFRKFTQKTATATVCVQVQTLPPTSDAAKFHVQRVYLQCQNWITDDTHLKPEEWGWYCSDNKLFPTRATLPPAPDDIIKSIRCNCKQGCESKRCLCRKHGLECSIGCGECRGLSCANSSPPFQEEADFGDDA